MSEQQQQIQPQPKKALFRFSIRWGTFCGISFFTCLGIVAPKTAILAWLLVFIFFNYLLADTLKIYSQLDPLTPGRLSRAFSFNYLDFIFFFVSVMVGILSGIL